MHHAIQIANYADFGDIHTLVDLARQTEDAGWDGFFIWDSLNSGKPLAETLTALTAIAAATERIRIGSAVLVLPRRQAWLVAQQTALIDQLSNGRLTLGVGIGDPSEYELIGENVDRKAHGVMLDEALAVVTGLWTGEPFAFDGTHLHLGETQMLPSPVQQPRIPIWTAGFWPNRKPFRRAARWDGIFPYGPGLSRPSLDDLAEIRAYIAEHRTSDAPFDIAIAMRDQTGENLHIPYTDDDLADDVAYAEAGVTWSLESIYPDVALADARAIIAQGPPRP